MSKRILLGAGHEGKTSGSTGAPGEQAFNTDVCNKLADRLRANGFEVRRINANPKPEEISGDWDLALFCHFDADIYGKGGGFLDRPKFDGAEAKSKAILEAIESTYFPMTGIVNTPSRRNANTRNYYMWAKLSSATPCVIIECGVGQHKPDDYEILFNRRDLVVNGIYQGVLKSFNMSGAVVPPQESANMTGDQFYTKFLEAFRKHKEDVEWGDDKFKFESEGLTDPAMIGRMIDNVARDKAGKAKELTDCNNKPLKIVEKEVIKEVNIVDLTKWAENGLTIEETKGNIKTITNFKLKG